MERLSTWRVFPVWASAAVVATVVVLTFGFLAGFEPGGSVGWAGASIGVFLVFILLFSVFPWAALATWTRIPSPGRKWLLGTGWPLLVAGATWIPMLFTRDVVLFDNFSGHAQNELLVPMAISLTLLSAATWGTTLGVTKSPRLAWMSSLAVVPPVLAMGLLLFVEGNVDRGSVPIAFVGIAPGMLAGFLAHASLARHRQTTARPTGDAQ